MDPATAPSRLQILREITSHLFGPSAPAPPPFPYPTDAISDQSPFTLPEMRKAIFSFNKNKAPGPDALDHNIIRSLFRKIPTTLLQMFNAAFRLNYFPDNWKEGELVFFKKEGKSSLLASLYRTITLLPILGKVYEKMLLRRINFHLSHSDVLSGRQHGFQEKKSTETALQQAISLIKLNKMNKNYSSLISIDFKGAFDNLPWDHSITALRQLGLPSQIINTLASFLRARRAQIDWQFPSEQHFFTRGCPQGSCLGPFLWLALLETLLKNCIGDNFRLIAYADDILTVVWGHSRAFLERVGNDVIKRIVDWANQNLIEISVEKSLAITFGKPKILQRKPIFKINNNNIKNENNFPYLGITIDVHLSFLPHLQKKREEIEKITQNLYKFSSIAGRLPLHFFKIWYNAILQRKLAYACPVWFPIMAKYHGKRHLLAAQRRALRLISRAYAKTSTAALQVLTGIMPLDIHLEAEAEFSMVTRLGISTDDNFAPLYYPKSSRYNLDPTWTGINSTPTEDFNGRVSIYTDGSKSPEGTGAAFCVYVSNILEYSWSARLSLENSVFQAELFAIKNALIWGLQTEYDTFQISTDSLSGLQALQDIDSEDYLITEIQQTIKESGKTFNFNWVRGHTGVEGNEEADKLAKTAAQNQDMPTTFLPFPKSHLKRKLKINSYNIWQDRWDTLDKGRYTHQFIPKVSTSFFINNRYLYIFLSNHGPFQQYLYKIGKRDSPLCVCGELSNSLHYVLQCTLTAHFHIKKHRQMSLKNWLGYLLEREALVNKIINCMRFVELHEFIFRNNLPFHDMDLDSSDEDEY